MSIVKKLMVGFVAFALVLSVGGGVFASEADEIRSEMDDIDATLQMILDLLGDDTVVPSDDDDEDEATTTTDLRIPTGFSFDHDLKLGMSGQNVMYLQILLNADPETRLGATGAGSPGNETTYFGPITQAAVKKFQTKYSAEVLAPVNLTTATGYVGVQTRNKLNTLLVDGVVETTPEKDEQLEEIIALLTQVIADVAALQSRVDGLDPVIGDEGDLTVERRVEIRNVELKGGQTKNVAQYRLKAEDSDVTVQRMDVTVAVPNFTEFRKDVDNMALYHDGEKVAEKAINSSTVARDDDYIRFTGLNIEVAAGGYEDVVIEVTAADRDSVIGSVNYDIGFNIVNAIRGVDGAGINVYAATADTRNFVIDYAKDSELLVEDADSPDKGIAFLDDTDETIVELLSFELTADGSDMELETLRVEFTSTGLNLNLLVDEYILYDGKIDGDVAVAYSDAQADAAAVAAGTTASTGFKLDFEDIDIDINDGDSRIFTVAVEVKPGAGAVLGSSVKADLLDEQVGGADFHAYSVADDAYVNIDEDVEGKAQTFQLGAPSFVVDDAEYVYTDGGTSRQQLNVSFTFDVTAYGEDIYLPQTPVFAFSGIDAADAGALANWTIGGDDDTDTFHILLREGGDLITAILADNAGSVLNTSLEVVGVTPAGGAYKIEEGGGTESVEILLTIDTNGTNVSPNARVQVMAMQWGYATADVAVGAATAQYLDQDFFNVVPRTNLLRVTN